MKLAGRMAQPDRTQGEAFDDAAGLAAFDVFAHPESIVGEIEDARYDILHQRLAAERDGKAQDRGAGQQRRDVDAEVGQHDQHRDQADHDAQCGPQQRQKGRQARGVRDCQVGLGYDVGVGDDLQYLPNDEGREQGGTCRAQLDAEGTPLAGVDQTQDMDRPDIGQDDGDAQQDSDAQAARQDIPKLRPFALGGPIGRRTAGRRSDTLQHGAEKGLEDQQDDQQDDGLTQRGRNVGQLGDRAIDHDQAHEQAERNDDGDPVVADQPVHPRRTDQTVAPGADDLRRPDRKPRENADADRRHDHPARHHAVGRDSGRRQQAVHDSPDIDHEQDGRQPAVCEPRFAIGYGDQPCRRQIRLQQAAEAQDEDAPPEKPDQDRRGEPVLLGRTGKQRGERDAGDDPEGKHGNAVDQHQQPEIDQRGHAPPGRRSAGDPTAYTAERLAQGRLDSEGKHRHGKQQQQEARDASPAPVALVEQAADGGKIRADRRAGMKHALGLCKEGRQRSGDQAARRIRLG